MLIAILNCLCQEQSHMLDITAMIREDCGTQAKVNYWQRTGYFRLHPLFIHYLKRSYATLTVMASSKDSWEL